MNNKNTKRALLTSVLSLTLCGSMLVGTTFAWFTDSVSSTNNVITAGNLDVELYYANAEDHAAGVWKKVEKNTKVFDQEALYEPGYTEVVYFKVVNEGSLALKYDMSLGYTETKGTNVLGDEFALSDYINARVIHWSEYDALTREGLPYFVALPIEMGAPLAQFETSVSATMDGWNETALLADEEIEVALALWMPSTVGNEANYNDEDSPKIDLSVNLVATQYTYEEDSFGNDYDKDATYDDNSTVRVGSYEELKAAVENGGTIVLAGDLAVDERITIQNGQNVVLDLNGHTLSANGEQQAFFVADGSITINNGTCSQTGSSRYITVGTSSATNPSSSDVDYAYATFNNVTFVNHTTDGGNGFGSGNMIHALGKVFVEVNECTFDVSTSAGNAQRPMDAYNWGNGVYVISEGTKMTWDYASQTDDTDYYGYNGYSVYRHIQLEAGCVFKETTDANGQTWYEVVKDTDNYIFVSTAAELANALENANSAGKNIAITADIDMSGVRFNSPSINNYAGNNTGKFIIDGGYHTVSNMQDMLIAYTGSAKLVEIRRLTLDKANIAVDVDDTVGTTGVGAFIGYAGTSEDINIFDCHLTNSTVNGGHWTGGFVGYAAGYSGSDGPVFETLEMKWSSVENSTITGKGSVGGFIGHATGDEWTKVEIHWYSVVGNTITSTGDSTEKAGSIMGTVGCAGKAKTVTSNAGVTKTMTGGVDVNNDRGTSENTVKSNGVANEKVYGRQGNPLGTLKVGGKVVEFE